MKIYLDSGVFVDSLIHVVQLGQLLRTSARRGRSPEQLMRNAQRCFDAIRANHSGVTSALTCYEIEEATYGALARLRGGSPNRFHVPAARGAVARVLDHVDEFDITLIALTSEIVRVQIGDVRLRDRHIRTADALHVTTAHAVSADLLITTDRSVIALDGLFETPAGHRLRCVDTDAALALL